LNKGILAVYVILLFLYTYPNSKRTLKLSFSEDSQRNIAKMSEAKFIFTFIFCHFDLNRKSQIWPKANRKAALPGNFFSNCCCSSSKAGSSGNLWSTDAELMTDIPLPDRTLLQF
jgi:hypothetical protein